MAELIPGDVILFVCASFVAVWVLGALCGKSMEPEPQRETPRRRKKKKSRKLTSAEREAREARPAKYPERRTSAERDARLIRYYQRVEREVREAIEAIEARSARYRSTTPRRSNPKVQLAAG